MYGTAMTMKFPVSEGEIVQDLTLEELLNHDCKSDVNYIVVCDVDYSDPELQKKTKWYPFCPDKLLVKPEMLSKKQQEHMTKFDMSKDFQML